MKLFVGTFAALALTATVVSAETKPAETLKQETKTLGHQATTTADAGKEAAKKACLTENSKLTGADLEKCVAGKEAAATHK